MKLSFSEVKSVTVGSVESYEDANGMHFAKCTKKQVDGFRAFSETLAVNATATTGVRLDFHTNSKSFSFGASSGARFELYINGVFTDYVLWRGDDEKVFSKAIATGKDENIITLFFPSLFFFLTKWIYCKTGCFDAAFFGPEGILSPALAFSQHPK